MTELLAPLRFLRIEHRRSKRYNFAYPAIGGAALVLLLTLSPGPISVFGDGGLLHQIQTFLSILGGFCIAALILLATDENPLLAEPFTGSNPPVLVGEEYSLTRRRFLAYLFGYLSFSCFAILVWVTIADLLAQAFQGKLPSTLILTGNSLFYFGLGVWLTHVGVVSMLGLYYLTERLHMRPPKIVRIQPDRHFREVSDREANLSQVE